MHTDAITVQRMAVTWSTSTTLQPMTNGNAITVSGAQCMRCRHKEIKRNTKYKMKKHTSSCAYVCSLIQHVRLWKEWC